MALEICNLTWTPPGAVKPLLDGMSLTVTGGECVVLQGPSGVGKSSLLRCATFLERSDSGEVRLDGAAVTAASIAAFRRCVTYTAQRAASVGDTVAENLDFPRRLFGDDAMAPDEVRSLARRLGLEGLDGGRRFDELSGGEQQRLSLVRSLAVQPRILLLDEPTSSLDPARVTQVEQILGGWLRADAERAIVWVTHDAAQAQRVATRIVEFRDRTLVER